MPSEELEALVAAETGTTPEEATKKIETVVGHRAPDLKGLIVYYIPIGWISPKSVRKFLEEARAQIVMPRDGGKPLDEQLRAVGYQLIIMPMRPDTCGTANPKIEMFRL